MTIARVDDSKQSCMHDDSKRSCMTIARVDDGKQSWMTIASGHADKCALGKGIVNHERCQVTSGHAQLHGVWPPHLNQAFALTTQSATRELDLDVKLQITNYKCGVVFDVRLQKRRSPVQKRDVYKYIRLKHRITRGETSGEKWFCVEIISWRV